MLGGLIILAVGLIILLSGLGVAITSNFWAIFWGVVFIVIGIKMMKKHKVCLMCEWKGAAGKMHEKFHGHNCCGDKNCCESKDDKAETV